MRYRLKLLAPIGLLGLLSLACGPSLLAQSVPTPTATPTKTPSPLPSATPDPALVTPTATPLPPTPTPEPPTATPEPADPTATAVPEEPTVTPEPEEPTPEPTATPVPPEPAPDVAETAPEEAAEVETEAAPTPEAEGDEAAPAEDVAYKIVHYKVLGEGENNGGVFNKGGMHHIFLTVLDENGNGLDGALVKDANGSALEVMTGDKGPGKAEIMMNWEPYKLYVEADPSGPTTSEISNQMNTAFPHIPDIVGKLGGLDNENSVCPTPDVRCTPPFYNVHFSYEITFQRQAPSQ